MKKKQTSGYMTEVENERFDIFQFSFQIIQVDLTHQNNLQAHIFLIAFKMESGTHYMTP
jgi:hypothetical protein